MSSTCSGLIEGHTGVLVGEMTSACGGVVMASRSVGARGGVLGVRALALPPLLRAIWVGIGDGPMSWKVLTTCGC